MSQAGQAQFDCSIEQVLHIKNQASLTLTDKQQKFKTFIRHCRQYKRAASAALADLYFLQQDYNNARKYFAEAYQILSGIEPVNSDEMKAEYALSLHFLNLQVAKSHDIFLQLRDKYHDDLPVNLNALYARYKISLSRQIIHQDLLLAALSSSRSFKNLVICPSINVTINFDYNSTKISPDSRVQIQEIRNALMAAELSEKGYQYELIGHTDIRGDKDYNQILSEKRAMAVKTSLLQLEPSLKHSLSALGKGESDIELGGNTEEIHRVNRRVEIRIACDN